MSDNDPGSKEDMRDTRKDPMTERTLRQFLKLESGMYGSKIWRKNYDTAIGGSEPLAKAAPCDSCEFIARTIAEVDWHEGRNEGHECCPDNKPPVRVALCRECGNALHTTADGHGVCLTLNCKLGQG
jgi:hypothetical protein